MKKPNILWVTTDQQRFDTVGALGNPYVRTPNLDRLVASGMAFLRAYVQSPICTPSRVSMMTGRYPASHHVHRNGVDHFPSDEQVLPALLKDLGYHCALIGKHHLSRAEDRNEVRPEDGYATVHAAHDPYPDPRAYGDWLTAKHGIDARELHRTTISRSPRDYGVGVPTELHPTTWWSETAIDFIQNPPARPWALNLNPIDPHPPWFPPEEYLSRYEPAALPLPLFEPSDLAAYERFLAIDQQWTAFCDPNKVDASSLPDLSKIPIEQRNPWDIPPPRYDAREVKAHYYATIELVDEALGRVLDALERSGQTGETLVIVTSDHGDMLGDHGLLYKGCRFYDGLVRVPLIISGNGVLQRGTRSSALVEAVDIAPTILEAAGASPGEQMQGKSLVPLLKGRADIQVHRRFAVAHYHDALPLGNKSHATMVTDGRHKSVVYHSSPGLGEIYDIVKDPGEFVNLWFNRRSRRLRQEIIEQHMDAVMATSDAGIPRTATY